jgi:hypothetical protein
VRLLDEFDAVLEAAAGRPDVQLSDAAPAGPFPSAAVLAVLSATAAIFESCSSNKQLYASFEVRRAAGVNGAGRCVSGGVGGGRRAMAAATGPARGTRRRDPLPAACNPWPTPKHSPRPPAPPPAAQHLTALLAAPDPEVVSAVLAALAAYLRKPHHSLLRWQAPGPLTARLLHMARGWGGKDEVGVPGQEGCVPAAVSGSGGKQGLVGPADCPPRQRSLRGPPRPRASPRARRPPGARPGDVRAGRRGGGA